MIFALKKPFRFLFIFVFLTSADHGWAEVVKIYYPDGQIKSVFTKEKGKLEGETRWFYPDGALGALMRYKKNQLHGRTETYYQNGNVKKIIHMRNNRPYGVAKAFSIEGKLSQIQFHSNGLLTTEWNFNENEENILCEDTFKLKSPSKIKWAMDLSSDMK